MRGRQLRAVLYGKRKPLKYRRQLNNSAGKGGFLEDYNYSLVMQIIHGLLTRSRFGGKCFNERSLYRALSEECSGQASVKSADRSVDEVVKDFVAALNEKTVARHSLPFAEISSYEQYDMLLTIAASGKSG
jgi:hypothetical protein